MLVNQACGAIVIRGMKHDQIEYQKIAAIVARCLPIRRDNLNQSGIAPLFETRSKVPGKSHRDRRLTGHA